MSEQPALVRRSFLGRIATFSAAVLGGLSMPTTAHAAPQGKASHPEDAWLDAMKGMHKNIYDCTSADGAPNGWFYARNFLIANTGDLYKMKDSDLSVIVSVRHFGSVFGYNDAMWAKYKFGEMVKVNDGSAPATRNLQTAAANELAKRGVVVTVCGMATTFIAGEIAKKTGLKAGDVDADLRANLVTPTSRIVAAGVVVTNRAQERGFAYTYVG